MKRKRPGSKLIGATLLVVAFGTGALLFALAIAPPGVRPAEILGEAARIIRDYEPPWTDPHITWSSVDPHVQNFDQAKLDDLAAALADRRTRAFLVVRGDRIVYEWYAAGWGGANTKHSTASLAKQLVGAMALFIALSDDKLSLDDAASEFIPAWKEDPLKSRITIRHLANHSSGIHGAARAGVPVDELEEWQRRYWRRDPDSVTVAIGDAPVTFEPGTRHEYSNPGMSALAYAITASIGREENTDLRSLLGARIMQPIGVPERDWTISYGERYEIDGLHVHEIRGGARYTARAIARVGQLILNAGSWRGEQLIDRDVIKMIAPDRRQTLPELRAGLPRPGIGGWFTNVEGQWPALPRDALVGAGAGHKFLLVIPSKDLVVVRVGGALQEYKAFGELDFWSQAEHHLFNPLMAAMLDPPYPAVKAIR